MRIWHEISIAVKQEDKNEKYFHEAVCVSKISLYRKISMLFNHFNCHRRTLKSTQITVRARNFSAYHLSEENLPKMKFLIFLSLMKVGLMFNHDLYSKNTAFGMWHIKKMTTTVITSKVSLFSRIKMSVCVCGPHQNEMNMELLKY